MHARFTSHRSARAAPVGMMTSCLRSETAVSCVIIRVYKPFRPIHAKSTIEELREKTAKLLTELNGVTILPEHINCLGYSRTGSKPCSARASARLASVLRAKILKPAETAMRWQSAGSSQRLSKTTRRRGRA